MTALQARRQKVVTAGSGITVTGSGNAATVAIDPATQADQEAASSTAKVVTPGRQQFHPSAAKFWGYATVATGVPTLRVSYNVTSITDTAVGRLGVTIGDDFSSALWSPWALVFVAGTALSATATTLAAGSVEIQSLSPTPTFTDPASWSFGGFGDQ